MNAVEAGIQRAVITGRIIPAVRMTQGGKWLKTRAQEYLSSQEAMAWQLKTQLKPFPDHTPLGIKVVFHRAWLYRGDWDNLAKAIQDALQSAGIIPNDNYVVHGEIDKVGHRVATDWAEVEIWEVPA